MRRIGVDIEKGEVCCRLGTHIVLFSSSFRKLLILIICLYSNWSPLITISILRIFIGQTGILPSRVQFNKVMQRNE